MDNFEIDRRLLMLSQVVLNGAIIENPTNEV
jgi:hypothetical protein